MTFLPDFSQRIFPNSGGGSFDRPVRAVVWHTTEGDSAAGAFGVYSSFQSCPHMTVDPASGEKFQHVPLTSSSYALQNLPGGCQTNTTGVIQIEVVGHAADTWSWSQERLRWLGEQVLAPILAACPTIPHAVYSGQRMTCPEWDAWTGGLCGHRDVPEQDHTDPGDLDLKQILAYATGDIVTPEDIEAIAQRTEELIWTRVLSVKNDAGALEDHAAIDVLAFAYEQSRRAAHAVEDLAKVAITTDPPHGV